MHAMCAFRHFGLRLDQKLFAHSFLLGRHALRHIRPPHPRANRRLIQMNNLNQSTVELEIWHKSRVEPEYGERSVNVAIDPTKSGHAYIDAG